MKSERNLKHFTGIEHQMVGQAFVPVTLVDEWRTFLSSANESESARRGRNAPHSRIRTDKNVGPTQRHLKPAGNLPGNLHTPSKIPGGRIFNFFFAEVAGSISH